MVCGTIRIYIEMTLTCSISLGQLIKIIREIHLDYVVDQLINYSSGKDEELRDISGLGKLYDEVVISVFY